MLGKSIEEAFVEKVAARARKMAPGDPLDPKTRLGAIASKKQLENNLRYIEIAKKEGATLLAGGARADIGTGKGYFLQPTVFAGVTPEMTIAREEIFGPVLATIEFGDVEEAIARANQSPYGLAAPCGRGPSRCALRRPEASGWDRLDQQYNFYDTRAFRRLQASCFGRAMSLHALEPTLRSRSGDSIDRIDDTLKLKPIILQIHIFQSLKRVADAGGIASLFPGTAASRTRRDDRQPAAHRDHSPAGTREERRVADRPLDR